MRAYRPSTDAPEAALNPARRGPEVPPEDAREALGLLLLLAEAEIAEALRLIRALREATGKRPLQPSLGSTRYSG